MINMNFITIDRSVQDRVNIRHIQTKKANPSERRRRKAMDLRFAKHTGALPGAQSDDYDSQVAENLHVNDVPPCVPGPFGWAPFLSMHLVQAPTEAQAKEKRSRSAPEATEKRSRTE
jgi:hypothetical protein